MTTKGERMKGEKIINELVYELTIFKKKFDNIFQEAKELGEKVKIESKQVKFLIRQLIKLIENFKAKLEIIEKMASKL